MGDTNSTTAPTAWPPAAERRPRLWPSVLIVLLYWVALKVPAWLMPGTREQFMAMMFGTMGAVLLFLVWWVFFSRVRWADRFLGLLACAAVGAAVWPLYDPSMRGNGRPEGGMMSLIFGILPVVFTGWVVWLAITRSAGRAVRLGGLAVVFLLTFGAFTAFRFGGVTGSFSPEYAPRWKPTAEEQFLASHSANPSAGAAVATAAPLEVTAADWPGFRGPARDGRRPGVRIATDWKQNPPKQLWRHRVGPGWGSFAVVGPRAYTQEQRGGDEAVVCYDAATGAEVWAHTDPTRHQDNESGAGPRATPTFDSGRVYALGGTGRLNCLDAATGKSIWSKDITADSGAKVPIWGFSASPLVAQGIVSVFAGGPDGKSVLGYKADYGELAWAAGKAKDSYCSTQLFKLAGVEQLVVTTGDGMTAFDPTGGKVLWDYDWGLGEEGFARITQPALVGESDLVFGAGFGVGSRRVRVTRDGPNWKTEQVWETKAISPYYNDLVVHKGHLYGFHSNFLTCINAETGKSEWRERGYANGQVVLLADQDLLLVVTESGAVALVEANPERRVELARFQALEGKTWNHPVVANGKLFVRNGEEAACYELRPAGDAVAAK